MSSPGSSRRIQNQQRPAEKPSEVLDLNLRLAFEGDDNGGSASIDEHVSSSRATGTVVAETSQRLVAPAAAESNMGTNRNPINVEETDDDVMVYFSTVNSTTLLPLVRQQSARNDQIIIIHDDSETTAGPAGLDDEQFTELKLRNFLWDIPEANTLEPKSSNPEAVEVIPENPMFECPICFNKLVEPSSTICGHIFCEKCIKASIEAQKKCPTCRKKLTMKKFHRVYLPGG